MIHGLQRGVLGDGRIKAIRAAILLPLPEGKALPDGIIRPYGDRARDDLLGGDIAAAVGVESDGHRAVQISLAIAVDAHHVDVVVACEARRRAVAGQAAGERAGGLHGHADGLCAGQRAIDGDGATRRQIEVVDSVPASGIALYDGIPGQCERAAAVIHAAAVVGRLVAGDRAAGHRKRAARDIYAAALVAPVSVGDRAAGHRKRAVRNIHAAAVRQSGILTDGAAVQCEAAADVHAAAVAIRHVLLRRVVGDRAAIHGETAAVPDVHAAAVGGHGVAAVGPVAGDRAAVQGQRAAVRDEDTAAAAVVKAAGDRAAGAGIVHGQTAVHGDGVAVLHGLGQTAAEGVARQVQGDGLARRDRDGLVNRFRRHVVVQRDGLTVRCGIDPRLQRLPGVEPDRREGDVPGDGRVFKVKRLVVQIPILEGVALQGGIVGPESMRASKRVLIGNRAAAVGIEGDRILGPLPYGRHCGIVRNGEGIQGLLQIRFVAVHRPAREEVPLRFGEIAVGVDGQGIFFAQAGFHGNRLAAAFARNERDDQGRAPLGNGDLIAVDRNGIPCLIDHIADLPADKAGVLWRGEEALGQHQGPAAGNKYVLHAALRAVGVKGHAEAILTIAADHAHARVVKIMLFLFKGGAAVLALGAPVRPRQDAVRREDGQAVHHRPRMVAGLDDGVPAVHARQRPRIPGEGFAGLGFALVPAGPNPHIIGKGDIAVILVIVAVADGAAPAFAGLGDDRAAEDLHVAAAFAAACTIL